MRSPPPPTPVPDPQRPGARAGEHLAAVALGLLSALVATWPLAARLSTHTMGEKFLRSYYLFWHMATHGPGQWWMATYDGVYFPDGGSGVTNGVPLYALGSALVPALGPVASVNIAILLHLALATYAGWRLSRLYWEGRPLPAVCHLLVGLGLGLTSQSIAVFANGQPENLGLGYVLLSVEGLLRWLRHGRPWALAGGAVAYALAFAMSPYLCMALLLLGLPLLPGAPLRRVLLAGAVLVASSLPLAWHFSRTVQGQPDRLFCPSELPLAAEADRLLPLSDLPRLLQQSPAGPPGHSLDPAFMLMPPLSWGDGHTTDGTYLGLGLLSLVAMALWRRPPGARRLLVAAAIPAVLGLGVVLHLHGWAPAWGGQGLPTPLALLRRLPVLGAAFQTIQFPSRLVVGVTLPLWLLAAPGAAPLVRRRGRLGLLILALPLLEQQLLYRIDPSWLLPHQIDGAHQALAAQGDHRAVLDLPPIGFRTALRAETPYKGPPVQIAARMVRASITHGHPVPFKVGCFEDGYYHPIVQDSGFATAAEALLAPQPDPQASAALQEAAARLSAAGFGWVAFHPGTAWSNPEVDRRLAARLPEALRLVHADPDGSLLLALPP